MTAENQGTSHRPLRRARDLALRSISESDYVHPTPERQAQVSAEIDRYFNTPLGRRMDVVGLGNRPQGEVPRAPERAMAGPLVLRSHPAIP